MGFIFTVNYHELRKIGFCGFFQCIMKQKEVLVRVGATVTIGALIRYFTDEIFAKKICFPPCPQDGGTGLAD